MRATWLLPFVLVVIVGSGGVGAGDDGQDFEAGFASITEKDLLAHATNIASPELEGRDSPSEGLTRAGDYIISRLKAAGVAPGAANESYRMTYTLKRHAPVPEDCRLSMQVAGGDETVFVLEEDFVPLPSCPGQGEGKLVFFGFGITDSGERYDDLKGKNCDDQIAMVLESEPRHKKLFEGPELTPAADAYTKVKALEERGARGVLIVRRSPAVPTPLAPQKVLTGKPVGAKKEDAPPTLPPPTLGYRYTWAQWNPAHVARQANDEISAHIPVLEISEHAASLLLGEDVAELAKKMDSSGKPLRKEREDVTVTVRAGLAAQQVPIDNIVGIVRGSDPTLAQEYLVCSAHYDHIGVDAWGRIGCGADDNGSGSSGLIELAEAMALAKPKRSVIFAWMSAEEDGLDGSAEFCERPPVPVGSIVCDLNVDMIGRCAEDEVLVIGLQANPGLEDYIKEAKKLKATQLKKVITDQGQDLWERSDHYNFHKQGIPALFFTEGSIEADNPDYHVFTDTVDKLSMTKMARISRFMFNVAWLVANAPERPPRPR